MAKTRQRARYTQEFKIAVVKYSLSLPATARVKPTCRAYPGIEPVQIRKWIKAFAPLVEMEGDADGAEHTVHAEHSDYSEDGIGKRASLSSNKSFHLAVPACLSRQSTEQGQSSGSSSTVASGQASPLYGQWPPHLRAESASPDPSHPTSLYSGSPNLDLNRSSPATLISSGAAIMPFPARMSCKAPAEDALAAEELLCLCRGIY